ncbi:MAG TPA: hypothetical protein G4O13_05340 [Dehalococcoidia bacterium]|nr:hypothetical protein [Dehalococcoidia bacterium]
MTEVESDILSDVIGCMEYHKSAPQFGERAWIAEGEEFEVVYWDAGNGWCDILCVLPKECKVCKERLVKFYRELQTAVNERYDENMCRID